LRDLPRQLHPIQLKLHHAPLFDCPSDQKLRRSRDGL
jgi:hypothetical protein